MGTLDVSLQRIFQQLIAGNAGLAIAEVDTYLAAWPNPQTKEKLDVLQEEYRLMTEYWKKGVRDPQLDNQYQRLLQRLYALCANIAIHKHMMSSSYLQGLYTAARQPGQTWSITAIRREMEDFVSDVAMLELEPENKRKEKSKAIYQQHQQQMNGLFNYILTGHIWTEGIGVEMEEILLSPTVDSNDQQLVVSAVTLSLMNRFDMVKFRTLLNVYHRSQDEHVRQRALVGWALSIDDDWLTIYPSVREMVGELLKSQRTCKELTELQMQLVYTLDAEKDTQTVQQEIIPDMLKNNQFRMTHNGLEEVADDPLEDILHPDAAEQRMEKLEASYNRMKKMQKQGADIFFGGFSQMKRFPFFYDISNWLVPFFMQHPDIAAIAERVGENKFLNGILTKGPFCNSDKYSFVIAFQQVMGNLPENVARLMSRGEVQPAEFEEEELQQPAYIRRSYLMDLYRFFRLFPNRAALCNPFDNSKQQLGMCLFFASELFCHTPLEKQKPEVVAMLRKKGLLQAADTLLKSFPEDMRDVQYYLWTEQFDVVLEMDPNHEKALAHCARKLFEEGNYGEAVDIYDRLLLLRADKASYMLNKAVCLVNMEEYEDALKLLYQLNYEHPDDLSVQRALAWALTCDGKLEQADKLFQALVRLDNPVASDFQNQGFCLWLQGRIEEAAEALRTYHEKEGISHAHFLQWDVEWLLKRGISRTDVRMMEDLIGA